MREWERQTKVLAYDSIKSRALSLNRRLEIYWIKKEWYKQLILIHKSYPIYTRLKITKGVFGRVVSVMLFVKLWFTTMFYVGFISWQKML